MTEATVKMATGPAVFEPPNLAPWQASIGGLIIGDGTPYEIAELSGIDEMPELRTSDEGRPWSHGDWDGDDWASGRIIAATVEIAADAGVGYDDALAAWRAVMVPTRTDELVPFWVYVPRRGTMLRWQVKVRRHRIPTDQQYELGLAVAELQLYASDPVGHGPQRQTSAGFPVPAGGLRFPLFSNGGTSAARTNDVTDPRAVTASRWAALGGVVANETMVTNASDGPVLPDGTQVTTYARYTVVTPSSGNATIGYDMGSPLLPVVPAGKSVAIAIYVRSSVAVASIAVRKDAHLDGTPSGSAQATPSSSLPANTWQRRAGVIVNNADFNQVRITSQFPSGSQSAGQVIDVTCALEVVDATTVPPHYDGDTLGARWLGAPNASRSEMWLSDGAAATGFLDFGLQGESALIVMDNPGNAETWAVHVIDGPVVDGFEIVDIPTGRRLRWVGDIPEGMSLTIDTRTGSVLLDDVADRSGQLVVREWAPVPPGGTSVGFFPLETYTSARLTSTWAPGWW